MKVLIAGGGIIGMLSALEFVDAGHEVVITDKAAMGREASWAGGGIVSPLYPWRYPPAVTALATQAQGLYPILAQRLRQATGIDPELNPCGMLMLDADDHRDAIVWAGQYGRRLEILNQAALARMGEGLGKFERGLWLPEVANIRNPRLLQALRRALLLQGVEFREGEAGKAWRVAQGRVTGLLTEVGDVLEADHYVVAAGAWSAGLLAGTVPGIAVKPVRGQMILFHAPDVPLPSILLHAGHYVIPRRDGHILCGSTLEDVGFDKETTLEARRQLTAVAESLVPGLRGRTLAGHWAGLRPGSPNGIPFIGRAPGYENLWVNTGHYRNGLVLAPASAGLLADLILAREPRLSPQPYLVA